MNNNVEISILSLGFIISVLCIALYVYSKYLEYIIYIYYKGTFEDLKQYHRIRYKLYFGGKEPEIDEYTQIIEDLADTLLDVEKDLIKQKFLNKRKKEQIMEETKILLSIKQS